MSIDGHTGLYVILGNPIGHSMSPAMHNAAFRALGLNNVYVACRVEGEELGAAVAGLKALGFQGGNVTVPLKEKIIQYLDGVSEEVQLMGAANTLYWKGDRLWGANTDGAGFIKSLEKFEPDFRLLEGALLLGAGGAARGVAVALALNGLKKIMVVNRDMTKGQALVDLLKSLGCTALLLDWKSPQLIQALTENLLVINTTSLGMAPRFEEMPPLAYDRLTTDHRVVDLIYKPAETRFLQEAKKRGCRTMNGIGMLLEQGLLAFRLFTRCEPPEEVMAAELERWLT